MEGFHSAEQPGHMSGELAKCRVGEARARLKGLVLAGVCVCACACVHIFQCVHMHVEVGGQL